MYVKMIYKLRRWTWGEYSTAGHEQNFINANIAPFSILGTSRNPSALVSAIASYGWIGSVEQAISAGLVFPSDVTSSRVQNEAQSMRTHISDWGSTSARSAMPPRLRKPLCFHIGDSAAEFLWATHAARHNYCRSTDLHRPYERPRLRLEFGRKNRNSIGTHWLGELPQNLKIPPHPNITAITTPTKASLGNEVLLPQSFCQFQCSMFYAQANLKSYMLIFNRIFIHLGLNYSPKLPTVLNDPRRLPNEYSDIRIIFEHLTNRSCQCIARNDSDAITR